MKKQNRNSAFFMFMIFLCFSVKASAQEPSWYNSVLKLLKQGYQRTNEKLSKSDKRLYKQIKKKDASMLAIHNINEHLKEVAKLRAQGKTEREIKKYFDAQRTTFGTGSISGYVYELDPGNIFSVRVDEKPPANNFKKTPYVGSSELNESTINVSIPNLNALANDTILVPIYVQFPQDSTFSSAEITFVDYPGMLDFIEVDTANSLTGTAGWIFQVNETDNLIITAFAGAEDISGEGDLFWIKFIIPDIGPGFIPITLESALFNTGKIPTELHSGGVNVVPFEGVTPVQDFVAVYAYNEYGQYAGSDYIWSFWSTGAYTISDLPTGDYYVMTSSSNYIDEYYDNATNWQEATLVHVIDGQETSGIYFILDRSEPYEHYEGSISGQVFDVDGNPIDSCEVTAYDEYYDHASSGSTDENGFYVVSGLPSGVYILRVHYWGSKNYVEEWYDDAQSYEDATAVTVSEPYTTEGIDFVLDYGGAISGRVCDNTGTPVSTYTCYIEAYTDGGDYIASDYTDENGYFIVSHLPTGNYKIYAGSYADFYGCWYDGADDFESATTIAVTTPDTTKDIFITLQVREFGAITGQVFGPDGQPLPDWECDIWAYDEQMDCVGFCQIFNNGRYMITRLPSGRYFLFAEYTGYTMIIGNEPASEWYDGAYEFEDATFVEVNAPDTTVNIDFTLEKGGTIMGRVYDPQGQLLSYSGFIDAYNLNGEQVGGGMIANDGLYFITGLSTGSYKLKIDYDGEENYFEEWYNGKQDFETADTVNVIALSMTSDINFTLEYACILQGFVTDAVGNHLVEDEHLIELYIYDANNGEYIDFENNSFTGGYQFKLLGRDYKLAAMSYYFNWMTKPDSLSVSYYQNGTSFHDPNTQIISLDPNTTVKLQDFVMEKVPGTISGTIYDIDTAQPMVDGLYIILALDEEGYLAKVSGYSEFNNPITGEYVLCGLKPGNYYLLAIAYNDIFESFSIQWYDGVEVDFDILNPIPKLTIPANATAVMVSEELTSGIDFYFDLDTDVNAEGILAKVWSFKLEQNYPNPFNPVTTIEYELPKKSYVEIHIYNIMGQLVETLVEQHQSEGSHSVKWYASNFPSGIYIYRIEAGQYKHSRKCLLLK